jgi:phosphatidylglycerophosphate synthase
LLSSSTVSATTQTPNVPNMSSNHVGEIKRLISFLKVSCDTQKAKERVFISRCIYRPVSFYISIPFVLLGFSANQVTWIRLGVALVSMVFLAADRHWAIVVGSLLYAIQVLLDYVDGNIARLSDKTSYLGSFLDGIVGVLADVLMPISVSLGLFLMPDQNLTFIASQVSPWWILLVGALTSVATGLRFQVSSFLKLSYLEAQLQGRPNKLETSKPLMSTPSNNFRKRLQSVILTLENGRKNVSELLYIGIVLFSAFEVMSLYLTLLCINSTYQFVLWLTMAILKIRRDLEIDP